MSDIKETDREISGLPEKFEFILLGSGLTVSLLSGALSRVGKKVLQLDKNNFYGSEYASFSLRELDNVRQGLSKVVDCVEVTQKDQIKNPNEVIVNLDNNVLYSQGEMIKLLIQSKAYRYLEFRSIGRMITEVRNEDVMVPVPASRSELFCSKQLSLMEKRTMMNFITKCSNDTIQEFDGTFEAFMDTFKLTDKLKYFISTSLCFCRPEVTAQYGISQLKRFLASLGKYSSSSSFLLPQYGAGELSQAFCRMSAVFGGINILDADITSINTNGNIVKGITLGSNTIACNYLIAEPAYIDDKVDIRVSTNFYQLVAVVEESEWRKSIDGTSNITIIGDDGNSHSDHYLITLSEKSDDVWGVCTNCTSRQVPKNFVMISLRSKRKEALDGFMNRRNYDALFTMKFAVNSLVGENRFTNAFIPPGLVYSPDYDYAVHWAKDIFLRLCPDDEWLPAMPDPSDIILHD